MTQQTLTQEQLYLTSFETFARDGFSQAPPWLQGLRSQAIERFRALGFPIARRGNEEWKYTDIGPVARTPFQHPVALTNVKLRKKNLTPFTFNETRWPRLVFLDGRYAETLSLLSPLPSGVDVTSLYQATMTKSDLVAQALAHHASYENNAFVALNTAFIRDGAFVHIPDGVVVEEPIHLLFLSTLQSQDTVSYPRVLIITGKQSQATVIESYGALTDDRYFTNSVTEIVVGKGAVVRYLKLQRQSVQSYHITNTHAVVTRDGSFSSVNLDFGGGLVRNNLNVLMDGEGGSCALTGLYMPGGRQHVDNQVIIDHARGYTNAKELYKGVLNDHARSVFHGSIIVRAGAKKVNAEQVDKNLLLSPHCEADTKPAFWIYCDDVRCGHGAACGQIDERQLFYLRSRGLSEQAARSWLVRGFVAEVVDTIRQERYKKHVDKLVEARLQEWLANDGPG